MTAPTGLAPFGTLVDDVYDLTPEVERVTDPNQSNLPTPITEDTVGRYITSVSSAVAAGIGPWGTLTGGSLDAVKAAARTVVANGAASYLQAARYPSRAGVNDSSYAGVLWQRYESGLAALKAEVARIIDAGTGTGPDPEDPLVGSNGGPFGSFPLTYFADGAQW